MTGKSLWMWVEEWDGIGSGRGAKGGKKREDQSDGNQSHLGPNIRKIDVRERTRKQKAFWTSLRSLSMFCFWVLPVRPLCAFQTSREGTVMVRGPSFITPPLRQSPTPPSRGQRSEKVRAACKWRYHCPVAVGRSSTSPDRLRQSNVRLCEIAGKMACRE